MFSELSKEWLIEQYSVQGKTINEIASSTGVSYTKIRSNLIKCEIPIRTCYESNRIKKNFPKELENKIWLNKKYLDEKASLTQIAKEIGCEHSNIRAALVRHQIPIRTKSEGLRTKYEQSGLSDNFLFDKSLIEGCLLGDGFLYVTNPKSDDCYPAFGKRNIYFDHLTYVSKSLCSENRIKDRGPSQGYANSKSIFALNTLTHKELLPLYREWYPESTNFKKIVPKSINMDRAVLLHWFLDDGYSYFVKRKHATYIRVQFATQSFSKLDLDMLCCKIKDKFGIIMYPRYHQRFGKIKGTGYFVELSQRKDQVKKFFEIIGPPPVPSLAYKWKIPNLTP